LVRSCAAIRGLLDGVEELRLALSCLWDEDEEDEGDDWMVTLLLDRD